MTEAEVEKNRALLKEYKKKTYEELDEIESRPNLTRLEIILTAVARLEKELEDGIESGTPMEEVFAEIYEDLRVKEESYIQRECNSRFDSHRKLYS